MTRAVAKHDQRLSVTELGFWLYIMTDLMLFASFFATYIVLRPGTNGGPDSTMIFDPTFALTETLILLASSFACGLAYASLRFQKRAAALAWLVGTLLLGAVFVGLEIYEFTELIMAGHGADHSAFLSGFFSLVGLHGLHIVSGLIWGSVLAWQLLRHPHSDHTLRKFGLFSIFWHFLDLVWIFIFTVVYLLGVIS